MFTGTLLKIVSSIAAIPSGRAGGLDEEIGPIGLCVKPQSLGGHRFRVVGDRGRQLERHPAVDAPRCALGSARISLRQRAGHEATVGTAGALSRPIRRGLRRRRPSSPVSLWRGWSDSTSALSRKGRPCSGGAFRGQQIAGDVVEPDALTELTRLERCGVHIPSWPSGRSISMTSSRTRVE